SLSSSIQRAWLAPTNRTHHASASLRLRATLASTNVSSTARSLMRNRVITGTLSCVKSLCCSPHVAPQEIFRPNSASPSRLTLARVARVSSRNRSRRALHAEARTLGAARFGISGTSISPSIRISSRSTATSKPERNQSSGTRSVNHACTCSAKSVIVRILPGQSVCGKRVTPPCDGPEGAEPVILAKYGLSEELEVVERVGLVVLHDPTTGRAVPPDLQRRAAQGVSRPGVVARVAGVVAGMAPAPPGQDAQGIGQFAPRGGELVPEAGRAAAVGRGDQERLPLQVLEPVA